MAVIDCCPRGSLALGSAIHHPTASVYPTLASALLSCFAQSFEHVAVVFRPLPERALSKETDAKTKRLLQRFLNGGDVGVHRQ